MELLMCVMLYCMDVSGTWSYVPSESFVITREMTGYVGDNYVVRGRKHGKGKLLRCEIDDTHTVSEEKFSK